MMKLGYQFFVQPTVDTPKLGEVKVTVDVAEISFSAYKILNVPAIRDVFSGAALVDATEVSSTAVNLRVGKATTLNAKIKSLTASARPRINTTKLAHPTPFFSTIFVDNTPSAAEQAKVLIDQIRSQVPIISNLKILASPNILTTAFLMVVSQIHDLSSKANVKASDLLKFNKALNLATQVASVSELDIIKPLDNNLGITSLPSTQSIKTFILSTRVALVQTKKPIKGNLETIQLVDNILKDIKVNRVNKVQLVTDIKVLITRFVNASSFATVVDSIVTGQLKEDKASIVETPSKKLTKIKGNSDFIPAIDLGAVTQIEVGKGPNLFVDQEIASLLPFRDTRFAPSSSPIYPSGNIYDLPHVTTFLAHKTLQSLPFFSGQSNAPNYFLTNLSGGIEGFWRAQPDPTNVSQVVGGHPVVATTTSLIIHPSDGKLYLQDKLTIPQSAWKSRLHSYLLGAVGFNYDQHLYSHNHIAIAYPSVEHQSNSSSRKFRFAVFNNMNLTTNPATPIIDMVAQMTNHVKEVTYTTPFIGNPVTAPWTVITITRKDPITAYMFELLQQGDLSSKMSYQFPSPLIVNGNKSFQKVANVGAFETYNEFDNFPELLTTRMRANNYQDIIYRGPSGAAAATSYASSRHVEFHAGILSTLDGFDGPLEKFRALYLSSSTSQYLVTVIENQGNYARSVYQAAPFSTEFDTRPISGQFLDYNYTRARTSTLQLRHSIKGMIDALNIVSQPNIGPLKTSIVELLSTPAKTFMFSRLLGAKTQVGLSKTPNKIIPSNTSMQSTIFPGRLLTNNIISLSTQDKKISKTVPLTIKVLPIIHKLSIKGVPLQANVVSTLIPGRLLGSTFSSSTRITKYVGKGLPDITTTKVKLSKIIQKGVPDLLQSNTLLIPGTLKLALLNTKTSEVKDVIKTLPSHTRVALDINKDVKKVKASALTTKDKILLGFVPEDSTATVTKELKDIVKGVVNGTDTDVIVEFIVGKTFSSAARIKTNLLRGSLKKSILETNTSMEKDIKLGSVKEAVQLTVDKVTFGFGIRPPGSRAAMQSKPFIGTLKTSKINLGNFVNKDISQVQTSGSNILALYQYFLSKSFIESTRTKSEALPAFAVLPETLLNLVTNISVIKLKEVSSRFQSKSIKAIKPTKGFKNTTRVTNVPLVAYAVLPKNSIVSKSNLDIWLIRHVDSLLRAASNPSTQLTKSLKLSTTTTSNTIKGIGVRKSETFFASKITKQPNKQPYNIAQITTTTNLDVIAKKVSNTNVESLVIPSYAFLLTHNLNTVTNTITKTKKFLSSGLRTATSLVLLIPGRHIEDAAKLANSGSLYNQGYATDYFLDGYVGEERFW